MVGIPTNGRYTDLSGSAGKHEQRDRDLPQLLPKPGIVCVYRSVGADVPGEKCYNGTNMFGNYVFMCDE